MNRTKRALAIDQATKYVLYAITLMSASFIIVIAGVILVKGMTPFITQNDGLGRVQVIPFLTGNTWLTGVYFKSSLYSIGFIIVSTIYTAILSLVISFPIGVLTALFIAKVAPKKIAMVLRTVVEMLASIPSIIYGLFGAGVILQVVYDASGFFGFQSKGGNSILSAVLVLALMTIPTITAISEVSIRSVDKDIEHASLALGASPTQTHFKVVLAAAKSGIFTAAILGIGRVLGEATAVSLVAGGRRSGFSFQIFDTTSTLTTIMLEGMKETTGIDYDIRFSVGLVLMAVIFLTNMTLNWVKRKVGNVHVK
jgi:phosphate transport system permease protein